MLPIITENDVDERLEAIDSAAGENAISTDEVHQMTETVLPNTVIDESSQSVEPQGGINSYFCVSYFILKGKLCEYSIFK